MVITSAIILTLLGAAFTAYASWRSSATGPGHAHAGSDLRGPATTASVIVDAAGAAGYLRQGDSYTVYANLTDAGNPPSGVATVGADLSQFTTGGSSVSLAACSSGCTIASVTYSYKSATQTAMNPLTSGGHSYSVTGTDSAGNSKTTTGFNAIVDNTAPTGGAIAANAGTTFNTTGIVALSKTDFTDTGSGMASNDATRATGALVNNVCGSLTGATPVTITGGNDSVTLTTGCYQYTLTGTDKVGNSSTATSTVVKVDTLPPSTTISLTPASPNGSSGWYKTTAPTFTLSASDTGSGVAATFYKIDAGSQQSYAGAVTIPDGQHTITYWSTDTAGNAETQHVTATIKVDTVTPANALTLVNQTGGSFLAGNTVYYKGNATGSFQIRNAVSDLTSGAASSATASLGGTSTGWSHTASTVSTPSGGPFVSNAFSWSNPTTSSPTEVVTGADAAGNTAANPALTFTNDITATAPTYVFPANGGTYNTTSFNAGSGTCTSAICGAASDAGAGVQKVEVSIQQGSGNYWNGSAFSNSSQIWNLATGTSSWSLTFNGANFPAEGAYTVTARVTDNVGNTSTSAVTFTIDRTAPTVTNVALTSGGALGQASKGDAVAVTYSEAMAPSSFCASWTTSTHGSNGNNQWQVTITENGTDDLLTVAASTASPCGGSAFQFGTVHLHADYVSATTNWQGTGAAAPGVDLDATFKILTVTLGSQTGDRTSVASSTPTYIPGTGKETDTAGNAIAAGTYTGTSSRF